MTTHHPLRFTALTVLTICTAIGFAAAAQAQSTFSVIEPSGKSISWKVEQRPASTTQPAATIYSIYDKASHTYHPTTCPAVEADLVARTDALLQQNSRFEAEMRMTPEQRSQRAINSYIKQMQQTPQKEPGKFVQLLNGARFVMSVTILCMAVAAIFLRVCYAFHSRYVK